jgi:hypothetical protein
MVWTWRWQVGKLEGKYSQGVSKYIVNSRSLAVGLTGRRRANKFLIVPAQNSRIKEFFFIHLTRDA